MASSTDEAGAVVAYEYNLRNLATKTTYPGDGTKAVTRTWDDAGRPTTVQDWLGHTTTYTPDEDSNIVSAATPVGAAIQVDAYGWDNNGQQTSSTFKTGTTTLGSLTYGRDGKGRLATPTTDSAAWGGQSHTYAYNALDQLDAADGADYSYDAADNLTRTATAAQQTFDDANQMCWTGGTASPASSCATNVPMTSTRYGYDTRGNRTSMTPSVSSGLPASSYAYDQENRMISASTPPPGAAGRHTPVGDFDGNGTTDRTVFQGGAWYVHNQPTVFFGLPGDIPVAANYDAGPTNLTTDRAVYRAGAWHIDGQPTVYFGVAGDIPVPGDYNGDGDAERAVYRPSDGGWYVEGLPTVFLGQASDIPVPADYDGNGTTDRAVYRGGAWYVDGRPTVYHGLPGDIPVPGDYDGTADRAVYRGGAWYVEGRPTVYHGVPGDTPVPGDYDGNGTTDRAVNKDGAWYVEGQATVYNGPASDIRTTTYAYDGDGLRTTKTTGTATATFTWDRSAALPNLLSDGTNTYIYGPDGLPLQQINNTTNQVTWLHHDQLGSTRLITGTTGTVTGTATYDPYGTPTNQTGTTTPLAYAGQYTDPETGFQYLRARYFDPLTAQFLTRDPIVAQTRSAYGYVDGNPLNFTDPSGLCVGLMVNQSREEFCREQAQSMAAADSDRVWAHYMESGGSPQTCEDLARGVYDSTYGIVYSQCMGDGDQLFSAMTDFNRESTEKGRRASQLLIDDQPRMGINIETSDDDDLVFLDVPLPVSRGGLFDKVRGIIGGLF